MIEIIGESADELFIQIAQKLYYIGLKNNPRNLETKELCEVYLTLTNPKENIVTIPERNMSMEYLKGEMEWYESGSLDVHDIAKHSPFWKNLADENGKVNSNYGYFVYYQQCPNNKSQFDWCVQKINDDPSTRQALIIYNQVNHKYEGNKDFVCTVSQFFRQHDGVIDCTTYMRSNDLIYGLTYDLPWFTTVHQKLCEKTGYKLGEYHHFVNSLHVYQQHYPMISQIVDKTIHVENVSYITEKMRLVKKLQQKIQGKDFPIQNWGNDQIGWDTNFIGDQEVFWFIIDVKYRKDNRLIIYGKEDGFYARIFDPKTLTSITKKLTPMEVSFIITKERLSECLSI